MKKMLILYAVLLVSGCSPTYNVEIVDVLRENNIHDSRDSKSLSQTTYVIEDTLKFDNVHCYRVQLLCNWICHNCGEFTLVILADEEEYFLMWKEDRYIKYLEERDFYELNSFINRWNPSIEQLKELLLFHLDLPTYACVSPTENEFLTTVKRISNDMEQRHERSEEHFFNSRAYYWAFSRYDLLGDEMILNYFFNNRHYQYNLWGVNKKFVERVIIDPEDYYHRRRKAPETKSQLQPIKLFYPNKKKWYLVD